MSTTKRNGAERRRRNRMLAMMGTALGTTLVPVAAQAQNVTYNGPGPYTLTQVTPVSGGPRAIDVTVTSGDATVDTSATTVTAANNGTTVGAGVGLANTGTGTITIRSGDVTATGTGRSNAIDAVSASGAVTVIGTGTASANTAANGRGISAVSNNGGAVTVSSNVAIGTLRGVAASSFNGNTFGGTTTLTSTDATATGVNTINAVLAQGGRVVVNSGTATNSNASGIQGTAIFVNAGTGGALLTAGTTTALGQNQAAMQLFSEGTVDVTSGTVRTTQNSDGISIASGTDIVVRSTSVVNEGTNSGAGIVLGANRGGGGFNSGADGIRYTSATVTSGSVTTAGAGAYGIYVTPNGAGTTTITSGAVTTTGANATGIFVAPIGNGVISGATTINSTGLLQTSGANATGIAVSSGTGAVTINNSGRIQAAGTGIDVLTDGAVVINSATIARGATQGAFTTGITVGGGTTGQTSSASVTSGSITGNAYGISVAGVRGDVTISSGTLALISTASGTGNSLSGIGISATGGGAVRIDSDSIAFTGTGNTQGISAQATGTGPGASLTINSRDVSVIGNGGYGILGASQSAAIAITSTGAITTTGTTRQAGGQAGVAFSRYADGILGYSQAGAIGIVNSGTITTSGTTARGISVETGRAIESFGAPATTESTAAITIANSGAIRTAGANAAGITIRSDSNPVTVTSSAITTSGATALGINVAQFGSGTTTINSGAITTTGTNANGIQVGAIGTGTLAGATAITSTGALQTSGAGAHGIRYTGGTGTLAINNSGTITTGGNGALGMFLSNTNGATIATNTIATTGTGVASGIQVGARAGATGPFSITSGSIAIQNAAANGTGIALSSGVASAVTIVSDTITNAGTGGGISISNGTGATGDVSITSRNITLSGAATTGFRPAIGAFQTAGTTVINSTGTIQSSGQGIVLQGRDAQPAGSVTINSNAITSNGNAIDLNFGNGVTVTSTGAIQTAAADSIGIRVAQSTGSTTVNNAGSISTVGSGISITPASGDVVVSNTGAITTSGVNGAGILVTGTTGATTIASNAVGTQGAAATGIAVTGTTGAIGITTTGTTSTAGLAANAIDARTGGDVRLAIATATAVNGDSVFANAGGVANLQVTSASAGGDGFAGVRVTGGTGVTLSVGNATSTGAAGATRADAIVAVATSGAITANVGSAGATGAGADAVRLIANGTGGAVTLGVTGNVVSASGYGVFIDPPGAVGITVAGGASVSGALAGISTVSTTGNSITNAGAIRGTAGAAIVAAGAATLDNAGTIVGSGATAVQFGASNDRVILRTGSSVIGTIQGGGGTDSATLIGTGIVPIASQTVAAFDGFADLTVQSGYWTAPATVTSTVAATTIASGAALELASGTGGIAGYRTGTIAADGSLVIRSTGTATSTFGATTVTGTGGVRFTGTGTATLSGTNSLANTGVNTIDAGSTLLVTGTQGGTFVNNGTFTIGTGGTTGTFTGSLVDNGTLIIDRSDAYTFGGALTGAGTFVKQGAGTVTFGSGYAFTGTTQLLGGAIRLSTPVSATTELDVRGTGTIDLSGQNNTIAELAGNSAAATVNIAGGALTVNQSTSTTFLGTLAGNGSLTKTGTGRLDLTGVNTYSGPTTVSGGTLAVNGSIVSPVTVVAGGALGGTGSVGTTTIASGGTWAPGNSIGTQTVTGNVTFAAGSIYAVEANALGQSDRVIATGTATLNGGTVAVNAAAGTYAQQTSYTILTANGGVTGQFATVTSNMAFLTPLLRYDANNVSLTLARNDRSFGAAGTTSNQVAVGTAIGGRAATDAIFRTILFQSVADAPVSFDALSGELHATVPTILVDSNRRVRDAILARGMTEHDGLAFWLDGQQSYGRSSGQRTGIARAKTNRTGAYGGIDYGTGRFVIGVNGGYADDDITVAERGSRANVETTTAGAFGALTTERATVQIGGSYAWHDIDTVRSVAVPSLVSTLTGSSKARSLQVFGEISYAATGGPLTLSPFVRYAHDRTRVRGVAETGGAVALTVAAETRSVDIGSAGLRLNGTQQIGDALAVMPRISFAYQRTWGDRDGARFATFGGTGPGFAVTGTSLGKDAANVEAGADLRIGSGFTVGAGGFVSASRQWSDYGVRANIGFRF